MDAVDQRAKLACVDEQGLSLPVSKPTRAVCTFVLREEPQTHRNLRAVEKLARQRNHAINQIGLDQRLADLALTGLV